MGRDHQYTPALGEIALSLAAEGKTYAEIAKACGVASRATIVNWALDKSLKTENGESFFDAFARAKEIGWELMADDLQAIADDSSKDWIETADGKRADHEHISRSKLRVDTRKFILSKRVPKTFGDKLDVSGIPAAQAHIVLDPREQLAKFRREREGA